MFCIDKDKKNNDYCSEYRANWPGSFQVHKNGECDLRGTYCAILVAYVLNLLDDELIEGVAEHIKLCQTFEGGLGPEPFVEAHGGYNFCGIATLIMLKRLDIINMDKQLRWLVNKQMTLEGGFQGRTNKLVDSCYSFWQASVFNMIIMNNNELKYSYDSELLYDQLALQAYILFCCQDKTHGGLVDKPGSKPDLFHTNYASAGLSLSQKCLIKDININISLHESTEDIAIMNPIFCLEENKVYTAMRYFYSLD